MRIALVTGSFLPAVGGVEWKVHHLATEYTRRGHEVTVFTGRPRISLAPVPIPVRPTYGIERCGVPIPGMGRLGITSRLFRHRIRACHRRHPFAVLHCHHLGFPTGVGVDVRRATGIPVVATACGADVQIVPALGYGDRLNPRHDRLVRDNLLHVDVVGSISSSVREEVVAMGTRARIADIPNGVAWEAFQAGPSRWLRDRCGLNDDDLVILSVGRNHPVKGYRHAIAAFAAAARRCAHLHYVIVGGEVTSLAPAVTAADMQGRIHLLESVPMSAMPQVFRSADVYFSPSLIEGFSQVIAQAFASGLPCLLSDVPGNRDAGRDGRALLVPAADEEAMAAALEQLAADPALRDRLGAEAHRASHDYAWSRIADRYLEIFASLTQTQPTA